MACLLLRLALTVPTKSIAGLTCDLELFTALQKADVALVESTATACTTLDSLIHNDDTCNNTVRLMSGGKQSIGYKLYNESGGQNLLTLASFSLSECLCPVLDFGCKQKCADINALRTINSAGRDNIMQLHQTRSDAAQQIRQEYSFLITAASQLLDKVCSEFEDECEFVEGLATKTLQ